jgi:predicted ATPase/class 3 adenylate cyclase/Tfp pilus assembly protein PilF
MTERALLFTDVVDSTRLAERLGDARAAEVWASHDRRARDLLARYKGREIGRADGFFLLFDDPADAARYALAYHHALADLALTARVGLHVGAVTLRENTPADIARGAISTEVEGLATPVTARLVSLARGGQTLLTAAARQALSDTLPEGAEIERHGHYRLKGVEEPVEIFELGVRDSSPFSPPADADKAYRVVRAGDFWRPVRELRHNLPAERDAFVGRIGELRALAARLDTGTRLLTVLGPGGTGKTRCVRRYGWVWLGDWPGGVYFCDLSEARSLDGIFFAVASALEVPLGRDDPAVQLGHAIAGRGRCLIILDNFEQVVQHAPATVGHWLDRAPEAAFIVTSRERLHIAGEESFPIEPLTLEVDAIDLFVARARAQRPDFVLNETNRAAVAEVVRLLDGLPLAIELAAARVRVLSPAQLVDRMRDRFSLLAGACGAAARQATLRAAIDWSWELLTPWEQAAFAQCSVFEGGFTLEAAEAVLDLSSWREAPPAMDAVQALVDKSLLRIWVPAEQSRYDIEEPYFGMYMSIHEYAAEKLQASGQAASRLAEGRHGRYFAGFGTDEAIEALSLRGGVKRRRELALELDNLIVACRRAVRRADGQHAVAAYLAIWEVLELQGPCALGIDLGSQVLAVDTLDASQRAAALQARATAYRRAGRSDEAATGFEQALAPSREIGDRRREAGILVTFGNLRRDQGRMGDSRAHLEASLAIAREVGNRRLEGNLIGNLGILHAVQGRLEEARAHFEQALAIHREVGNRRIEGIDTSNLGNVYHEQGKFEEAGARYQQALAIHREVGNRRDEGVVIGNFGVLCRDQGRLDEARERCEDALAIVREVGDRLFEGVVLGELAKVLRDQGGTAGARAHLDQALAIHRAVGNRRSEGTFLGILGELLAREGRFDEARELLQRGESLLREVGDQLGLVSLLCDRGRAEVAAGDLHAARAALASAETVAKAMGAGPDSEVGRGIVALRDTLA